MEISKVNVIDDSLINVIPEVPLIRGPSAIAKNFVSVSGNPGTSNFQFNVPIQTVGTCLDLRCYLHVTATFAVTVQNQGAVINSAKTLLIPGGNISMGPLPLNSMFTSGSDVTINSKPIMNYNIGDVGDMLYRLYDMKKLNEELPAASYPELAFAQYPDAYLTTANPCGSYADSSPFAGVNNGSYIMSFPVTTVNALGSNNVNTLAATGGAGSTQTVYVTVDMYEPINLSPFVMGQKAVNSPYYVQSILLNLVIGSCNRVFRFGMCSDPVTSFGPNGVISWSNAAPPVATKGLQVTGVTLQSVATAEFHYFNLTPCLVNGFSLPKTSIIHCHDVLVNTFLGKQFSVTNVTGTPAAPSTYPTALPLYPKLETQTITLSNQTSTGCPRYMIVGVKKKNSEYDPTSASFYYPISNLNISEGNNQSLLAKLNQVDLFNICKRSGSRQDFPSFLGLANSAGFTNTAGAIGLDPAAIVQTCSGPVVLEFGRDIPLPFNIVPGASGVMNFTISATCVNTELVNGILQLSQPTLYVVFVYDKYFITDSVTGSSDTKQCFLTAKEIMGETSNKESSQVMQDPNELQGGALHRMHNAHGSVPQNISSAKHTLSKRIVH